MSATGARFGLFGELSQEDWAFTLHNEVDLVFYATQAAWPHLIARGGGVVINTGSAVAVRGNPNMGFAAHAASKGAIVAFTRALSNQQLHKGIRVNCVCPGPSKFAIDWMSLHC